MEFISVLHRDVDSVMLDQICEIKNENWNYGSESQRKWIENNISANDIHLVGVENRAIVTYCNIVLRRIHMDSESIVEVRGIGNVCVRQDLKGRGLGKELMKSVNSFLIREDLYGLLLCKRNLIGFYKNCDWAVLDKSNVQADFEIESLQIMTLLNSTLLKQRIHLLGKSF
ncbi:MAG: GNAT family N-acetyltransferase [Flavobacterium sp.]|nr:MAG: GNAT family N-acetyltransferase [Flavobacterium sp.]